MSGKSFAAKNAQRADDLDDDFEIEPVTDATLRQAAGEEDDDWKASKRSAKNGAKRTASDALDSDGDGQARSASAAAKNGAQKKLRADDDESDESDGGEEDAASADDVDGDDVDGVGESARAAALTRGAGEFTPEELAALKRARRKKATLKRKEKLRKKDLEKDTLLQSGSQEQQTELFKSELRNVYGNALSSIELDEFDFQVDHFVGSTFSQPHTLKNFADYIKSVIQHWGSFFAISERQKAKVVNGAPKAIIVVPAATRAVEVIRALDEFNSLCRIGKLFSKHIKIEEQVQYLNTHPLRLAVGTPSRLSKLAEQGALRMAEVEYIIVDGERNAKHQNIFQLDGVNKDLFEFLRHHCMGRMKKSKMKVCLF